MAEQQQGLNGSAESVLERVKSVVREAVRGGMRPTVRRLDSVERRVTELERRVEALERSTEKIEPGG